MNSLNFLSASVLGTSRPVPQRAHSVADASRHREETPPPPKRAQSYYNVTTRDNTGTDSRQDWSASPAQEVKVEKKEDEEVDEKVPLLQKSTEVSFSKELKPPRSRVQHLLSRLSGTITETVKWIVGKLFAPGFYLLAFFYTEDGHFSPLTPVWRLTGKRGRKPAKVSRAAARSEKRQLRSSKTRVNSSDSEGDFSTGTEKGAGQVSSSDESTTSRRSIRIRQNEETARRRKAGKKRPGTADEAIAKELKSPTSPGSDLKLTKYPHAPAPPRPLIPRRQPSYTSKPPQPTGMPRKTLVLDLDETLIHSMAKGGRMSTGHMVEVKLSAPTAYGGVALGPQHPILYYVHKRPFCDEFLRQVSKWYDLVVFTASVQEYADPVIDWLELERKYFSARKYRQHCTFRNGAYIKDLGSIEPDLSRVMILDNSPLSYIFHEDNAIPIEGWINDPTDSDLMHLIPLLEGLQFVTDVRAFLGLRRGEIDQGAR